MTNGASVSDQAGVSGTELSLALMVIRVASLGAAVDISNRFGGAAFVTFLPPARAALLFFRVPETKDREPEDLWPEVANERMQHL